MVFIPMVPHERPPSGRALDLGRRLKAEVEKFEAQYPGTSREDLRAAAGIAIGEASGRRRVPRQVRAAVAGVIGAIVALGVIMQAATSAGVMRGKGAAGRRGHRAGQHRRHRRDRPDETRPRLGHAPHPAGGGRSRGVVSKHPQTGARHGHRPRPARPQARRSHLDLPDRHRPPRRAGHESARHRRPRGAGPRHAGGGVYRAGHPATGGGGGARPGDARRCRRS